MFTPTVSYICTWLGLSFLYFAYWDRYPAYTRLFAVLGAIVLVVMLVNALKP